jgi:hypothetical protein
LEGPQPALKVGAALTVRPHEPVKCLCRSTANGRAEVAVGSDDDSIGIWATIVWTTLAFGVVALIALFSKFPG